MYEQDSFFDLTLLARVGLVCISVALAVLFILAARALLGRLPVWARIFGALVILWIFVWVSPQIYYTYYRMIIPDLPLQWVIWPPPGPDEALRMLVFQGPQNLSAHSQGLLGWALLAVAVFRKRSA